MRKVTIGLISFFLIGGSSLIALFLIGKNAPPTSDASKTAAAPAVPLVGESAAPAGTPEGSMGESEAAPAGNLTESFARKIAEEILRKNPSGPRTVDGQIGITAGSPQELIDRALDEETARRVIAELRGEVDPGEVKAAKGGANAEAKYLADIRKVMEKNQSGFSPRAGASEIEQVRLFKAAVQKAAQDLLAIEVPASLASWHREMLIMLRTQENAFQAMERSSEDPLKALIALRSLREAQAGFTAASQKLEVLLRGKN